MSFTVYTPTPRREVRLGMLSLTVPARDGLQAPFLLLSRELMEHLKWKAGMTVQLAAGNGADFGMLRLQPDKLGTARIEAPLPNGKRKRHRIFIGRPPVLSMEPTKCDLNHEVKNDTLFAILPQHTWRRLEAAVLPREVFHPLRTEQ